MVLEREIRILAGQEGAEAEAKRRGLETEKAELQNRIALCEKDMVREQGRITELEGEKADYARKCKALEDEKAQLESRSMVIEREIRVLAKQDGAEAEAKRRALEKEKVEVE